jgi:hypothetical protein
MFHFLIVFITILHHIVLLLIVIHASVVWLNVAAPPFMT